MPSDNGSTTRFKDFDQLETSYLEKIGEPPTFRLRGQDFRCHPYMSVNQLNRLTVDTGMEGVFNFLYSCVVDEQQDELRNVLDQNENPVFYQILNDIMEWLIEAYNVRPTARASSSRR